MVDKKERASYSPEDQETAAIMRQVLEIKKSGFGEVRIVIKNGTIFRILTTKDCMLQKE